MKYECTIINIDEDEVTINIDDVYITGFTNSGVLRKEGDKAFVELVLYDDIEICISDISEAQIERKGNTFSYSLYGILDIDRCMLLSLINFEIDKDELFDYGFLDGKMVRIDVMRLDIRFD